MMLRIPNTGLTREGDGAVGRDEDGAAASDLGFGGRRA
jgi:hypothetical protein